MVAPKDTPTDIIARVQRELAKALQNSDLTKKLDDMSAEPVVNSPRLSAKSGGKRRRCGKPRSRRPASRWSNARSDINGPGNDADMKVLIIGGGIGGLTTALSLEAAGIDVEVFEQASTIEALGVGINLQPNAVRELTELASATN